ncbi:meso-2,3-butanediol dehydrogenase-like [Achroia grisella]|uniref:meso-2,3-butanediol dehydrogenase-like n=1 Tax=Achroia grisella TaxID=688607 RepID=UPI0027D20EB3|nr:meso-2,3-butanediol dehydrogenase-like [Achroia grisella]
MDFSGKVALVTGGSSGIGAACAKLLAIHGAHVALVGRNEERLNESAMVCHHASGSQPLQLKMDLTENGKCQEAVERTIEKFGKLDILVNSAGKCTVGSLLDDTTDVFDELTKLNLGVTYKITHYAIPHLAKTKGNIVIVVAAPFQKIRHGFGAFSMMNAALIKFTNIAAVELANLGVRINSVGVTVTRTNILSNINIHSEDEREMAYKIIERDNKMKILDPEEVAKMVVFISSNLCPNMNGANVCIDSAATSR